MRSIRHTGLPCSSASETVGWAQPPEDVYVYTSDPATATVQVTN